ncbi:DUF3306 domain-containing protein [Roseibium sp.]|uniref:DUF3306 domain-containing protein n=1 Tax=Roseibium sp. TaxID=1936156 RepID=UPI003A96F2D3
MTGNDKDEGFLSRWSRRKRGVEEESEAAELQVVADETSEGDEHGTEPQEDPELVANREAAEAVDLETLTYESDFTVFMKNGVPAALKNAALQKLWRSNPVLAVLDGLNDYDEDYRIAQGVMGQFESAWKVGKGYADKAEEVAAEMEAKSARLAEERERLAAGEKATPVAGKPGEEDLADNGQPAELSRDGEADDDANATAPVDIEVAEVDVETEMPAKAKIPSRRRMSFTTE